MTAPIGIYVRVSRKGDREDDRFHSPKEQAERAASLARAEGYVPGPVFEDIDVSGATQPAKRPAMGALLAALDRGELAGVAAFSLDRLSREPAHGDSLVKRITKAGGVILTPDIPDALDTPTGEFTFGMLLQVAKLYRSQAGARFASAKERAIRAGIPLGDVPFGYRRAGQAGVMEVDPEAAPVVRELYERRARGERYAELLPTLERAAGRTYTREGLRALIRNRLYATGRLQYGELVSDVEAGAIVDEPLWHAAQSAHPSRPARSGEPWLLTGLLKCAACGHNLRPSVSRQYRSYRCGNRQCSSRAFVTARWAEHVLTRLAFEHGDSMQTRADAPDLAGLEDALATAERRLEQVDTPEAMDALGERWAANVKARRAERDEAAAALGEARTTAGVEERTLNLRELWDALSAADRRATLALVWKEIRVGRKGDGGVPVTFVGRGPQAEAEVELPA